MKKALSIITGMSMLLSLVSCSSSNDKTVQPTTTNSISYNLTEEYSDEYVSIKYDKSWSELDDHFTGPAYTISGSSEVHVSYSFYEENKINNDVFIEKNIPSGKSKEDSIYTNKNNVRFLKIWKDNTKMYLHATKDCVIHIEFDNCYDVHYKLIEDFLDNISIKSPDATVTKVTTTSMAKKSTFTKKTKKTESLTTKTTTTIANTISTGYENALKSAKSYISHSAFSYNELIEQLEYGKYSHDEAVYGADNCGADWNAEALEQAQSYISHSAFSYSELYDQLIYGQFTSEQAQYGVDNCGADWNAEAVEQAESYLSHSSFSREELYDQLIYEGFTPEQAEHGVSAVY